MRTAAAFMMALAGNLVSAGMLRFLIRSQGLATWQVVEVQKSAKNNADANWLKIQTGPALEGFVINCNANGCTQSPVPAAAGNSTSAAILSDILSAQIGHDAAAPKGAAVRINLACEGTSCDAMLAEAMAEIEDPKHPAGATTKTFMIDYNIDCVEGCDKFPAGLLPAEGQAPLAFLPVSENEGAQGLGVINIANYVE